MDLLELELVELSPPVLVVQGEIDLSTTDQLRAALRRAVDHDPDVRIDLTGLTFIDAAGPRVFLDVAQSLDGGGPLRLVNAPLVARLLDLVGLRDLASIEICSEEPFHGR